MADVLLQENADKLLQEDGGLLQLQTRPTTARAAVELTFGRPAVRPRITQGDA